jgi:hypothetical protein
MIPGGKYTGNLNVCQGMLGDALMQRFLEPQQPLLVRNASGPNS